jgi:Ni/Co efflux regulator RcnB
MSRNAVLTTVIVLSLTSGAPAFAHDDAHQYERGRHEQTPRNDDLGRNPRPAMRGQASNEQAPGRDQRNEQHRAASRGHQPPQRGAENERRVRGAGPNHVFHRGGRLSSHYRQKGYVVHDWHGRHLRAPPHGYHWVQTGSDFVLAAIVSGIIAEIVLSH